MLTIIILVKMFHLKIIQKEIILGINQMEMEIINQKSFFVIIVKI